MGWFCFDKSQSFSGGRGNPPLQKSDNFNLRTTTGRPYNKIRPRRNKTILLHLVWCGYGCNVTLPSWVVRFSFYNIKTRAWMQRHVAPAVTLPARKNKNKIVFIFTTLLVAKKLSLLFLLFMLFYLLIFSSFVIFLRLLGFYFVRLLFLSDCFSLEYFASAEAT